MTAMTAVAMLRREFNLARIYFSIVLCHFDSVLLHLALLLWPFFFLVQFLGWFDIVYSKIFPIESKKKMPKKKTQ